MGNEEIVEFITKESNKQRNQYLAVYVGAGGVERFIKKLYSTKEDLIEDNDFISKKMEVLTIREVIKPREEKIYYYNLYRFRWTHLSVSRPYVSLREAESQKTEDHVFFETRIVVL